MSAFRTPFVATLVAAAALVPVAGAVSAEDRADAHSGATAATADRQASAGLADAGTDRAALQPVITYGVAGMSDPNIKPGHVQLYVDGQPVGDPVTAGHQSFRLPAGTATVTITPNVASVPSTGVALGVFSTGAPVKSFLQQDAGGTIELHPVTQTRWVVEDTSFYAVFN